LVLNLSGENSGAHASPEEIFVREKVFDNVPDNAFALIGGTLERSARAKGWAAASALPLHLRCSRVNLNNVTKINRN